MGDAGASSPVKDRAAMDGDATFQVKLVQPVHVLILYGTAVATEDGAVHFLDDIYGQDRRLEALLGLEPVMRRPAGSPVANAPRVDVYEVAAGVIAHATAAE